MSEIHNKVERPEGQFAKRFKVVMDINALPERLDMATFAKLTDMGYIIYDSTKGNRPKLYIIEGDVDPAVLPSFVDTEGKEVDLAAWQKKYDDEEYWRKELYKCRQSPVYYFVNYISTSAKPTQKQITEFLEGIGLGPTSESVESEEALAIMKAKREAFASSVLLETLQLLKPVKDSINAEYEDETEEKFKIAAEKLGMEATDKNALKDKMIAAILKTSPLTASGELEYYLTQRSNPKKRKWDRSLIRATDADVIVRLWETL